MTAKMHDDELEIDAPLVRRLLEEQFPEWASLPIERVELMGTDHALYRLGGGMVARLPRIPRVRESLAREWRWLPRIGPQLPLAVPEVLAEGIPGEGYPSSWSVYSWVPGERVALDRIRDQEEFATELSGFIAALQQIDPTDGPTPGRHNGGRGEPLAQRDAQTRAWFAELEGRTDTSVLTAVWEDALRTPLWNRPPVWIHGDLDAQNLLMTDGRLTGAIDFGCLAVGDPACDVMVAWKLLTAHGREVFRSKLSIDDATWARSRGWVASQAAGVIAYYTEDNHPVLVRAARHWVAELSAG